MILTGLDLLVRQSFAFLKGKRIALLLHTASVDQHYRGLVDLLQQNQIKITTIFAPEHGIHGAMQDMEGVPQEERKIRYISLYDGTYQSLFPQSQDLQEVDHLLIDIQDVGSRYYTYVYTASFLLKAAKEVSLPVTVLDRPNPIGSAVSGNMIEKGFTSFVGYYPYFPNQHGLTIGEMLQLINDQEINADLTVIPMENYQRRSLLEQSYSWVFPSPNMPTIETAHLYTGGCLIEGTNLSEGRGTTRPFHLIGAPYVDGATLKRELDRYHFSGVAFRDCSFKPMFQKHSGKVCQGVELHITDHRQLNALEVYLGVIYSCIHLFPQFRWRTETYEFVDQPIAIDLLFGTDKIRKLIEADRPFREVRDQFLIDLSSYKRCIQPYLLYPM